jgi:hypothetical protein
MFRREITNITRTVVKDLTRNGQNGRARSSANFLQRNAMRQEAIEQENDNSLSSQRRALMRSSDVSKHEFSSQTGSLGRDNPGNSRNDVTSLSPVQDALKPEGVIGFSSQENKTQSTPVQSEASTSDPSWWDKFNSSISSAYDLMFGNTKSLGSGSIENDTVSEDTLSNQNADGKHHSQVNHHQSLIYPGVEVPRDINAFINRALSTSYRFLIETNFPKDGGSGSNEGDYQNKWKRAMIPFLIMLLEREREKKKGLTCKENQKPTILDRETFTKDALQCTSRFYDDLSLTLLGKIGWAYDIYQKATRGTGLGVIVLGRTKSEKDGIVGPANEQTPYMDKALEENLVLTDEVLANETGSIMGIETPRWSLLANDAWILGGVHAEVEANRKTEFHFASPLRWENFWKDRTGRMTLMAREIIELVVVSGYELRRPNPELEAIAVCVDKEKASNASLLKYKEAVEKYKDPEAMKNFFESLPSEVRE